MIFEIWKFFLPTNAAQLTGFLQGAAAVVIYYIILQEPIFLFLEEFLPANLVDNFVFQLIVMLLVIIILFFVLNFFWDRFFDKSSRCWRAYDKGEFKSVIKIATPMAERGNPDFQYLLGITYDDDEYPFRDTKRAIDWLSLAAEKKHEFAQFQLGYIYDQGCEDIKPSYENAVKWYELSSKSGLYTKSGFDLAQFNLGLIKLNIEGEPIDLDGAIRAFKLAGEQGNLQSLILLGALYFDGDQCTQDYQKCIQYCKLVVEQEQGYKNGLAEYMLGRIYESGLGVPVNIEEALKWYKQSAKYGDFDSMNNLGLMYYFGDGVEKDEAEGERLLKKASELGSQDATSNLEFIENNSLPEKYEIALNNQKQKAISRVKTKTFAHSNVIVFPSRK